MPTEQTGRGDPARTIALLWGTGERPTRGPKPGLTVDRIVAAAIAIADADGLEALTMRRVAERLGVGTMTLYRYLPGKAELLDVMVDRVAAETARPDRVSGGWRERLEQIARENFRLYERHPWLLHVFSGRPPLGPNIIAKYDHELAAVAGIGLSDVEMDSVLTLLHEFVRGAAATAAERARTPARTGQTDDEWWLALAPLLETVVDPARYPLAARVGAAATEHYQGASDPRHAFEFGLERLLDGIAVLVDARRIPVSPRTGPGARRAAGRG
jgi:AcrR family transcriptional regulator